MTKQKFKNDSFIWIFQRFHFLTDLANSVENHIKRWNHHQKKYMKDIGRNAIKNTPSCSFEYVENSDIIVVQKKKLLKVY